MTWRFRICNYFCKISKSCDFMNNLSNFVKSHPSGLLTQVFLSTETEVGGGVGELITV